MPEPTILDTIVARRKLDVAEAKLAKPAQALQAALAGAPAPIDFAERLRREGASAMFLAVDGRAAGLIACPGTPQDGCLTPVCGPAPTPAPNA